ncbi:hypothetical protein BKA93DRAFT_726196 [Sparassis latifolia]
MSKDDNESITVYESRPPEWLPKTHASADLGYVGYFPPRGNEDEEILSETKVKNGLVLAPPVLAETLSLQDNVRHCLVHENAISELEDLMNQIFARRAENVPPVPAPSFRLPSRVTLNEARRQAWFSDLANPDVPLSKLGKNVPHGAKGHDLLDLLHTHNVAIPRAVWFLRVFGGNETAGLRNKQAYNPTQYSVDWANVVTSYMKKQLADIALPSAPRLGFNIKQTFKGELGDADKRERWISRFTYCLGLLRTFYAEGLVDKRTFLSWLVQQMSTCNLAQLGFIAKLADEYLEGMLVSRAITRPFVDASLQKLSEIRSSSAREFLGNVEAMLKNLISRSFLSLPDAFVSPRAWTLHSALLEEILSDNFNVATLDSTSDHNAQALCQTFAEQFADVRQRNEAMLFWRLPSRVLGPLSSALSDIKLLNSLSGKTDMCSVIFFEDGTENSSSFTRKLDLLLTWSVTSLQYGDHRPYAAACLLREWRNKAGERAIRHDAESPDQFLQDQLFDWLDTSEVASESSNLPAVSLLFGQLVKYQLYSYQDYIQRLIARGERGLSFGQDCSRHRDFLRWIPLHNTSPSLVSQRKVTLYGVRAREIPEDLHEREIRKEIRQVIPELFAGVPDPGRTLATTIRSGCSTLLSSPRFEQVKTMKQWLLPVLKKSISNQRRASGDTSILKSYTMATILMAHTRCYGSILDITLFTLEHAASNELLTAVMETLRQHMEVWACMNIMHTIATALYASHQFWRTRGIHTRALLSLLIEVDNDRYLEPASREHILADITAYTNALYPINQPSADTVPLALPEILMLATDPDPEAPSNLAKSLWYRYLTAPDWAWKVWDNTVASLRQIPSMIPDSIGRRVCALRYAVFLSHVDQHLPEGFDDQVLQWFLGAGRSEVAALSADVWEVMTVLLLHLSVCGALTTTTILQGLIYPVWKMGATVASVEQGLSLEVLLTAVNALFEHLLLKDEYGNGVPPRDIFEARGLQTRRRDVFREPYFSSLIDNLPILVLIEQNQYISEISRRTSLSLRQAICKVSVFRQGVYRDLDAVRLAFEKLLECRTVPEETHQHLVSALRMMLRDPAHGNNTDTSGFQAVSSLLSPWKLAATSIEMRLTLKQLGEGLARESSHEAASTSLDELTDFVFHHCTNMELVDFVAEMMVDVDREVATKFVDAGLHCITETLRSLPAPLTAEDMAQFVSNVGEVLRLLSNIVQPFQDETTQLHLTPVVQEDLALVLKGKLEEIKNIITAGIGNLSKEADLSQASHFAIFLARLLQFNLRFRGDWSPQMKTINEELCSILSRLSLLHTAGSTLDLLAFPLLLDTLYYVLDEIPTDPKTVTLDPCRNYPEFDLADLPSDMPPDFRRRLRSLLPYVSQNLAVCDLAYATRDASGSMVANQPVQNRPWEWTEYLGNAPAVDPKRDDKSEHQQLKNSTSLSLELFGTKMTGDSVVHSQAYTGDSMVEGNLRTFQDDLSGESVFMRDWRETRIGVDDAVSSASRGRGEQDDGTMIIPTYSAPGQGLSERRPSSRRASPALSVRTRASMLHHSGPSSVSSFRQSPVQHLPSRLSVSTASEPIDVDSFELPASASQSTAKRRSVDDDDELEIVEGPVPASRAKKSRAKAGSKIRTKKR